MIGKLLISLGCTVKFCSCGCGLYRGYIPQSKHPLLPYFTFINNGYNLYLRHDGLFASSTVDIRDPNSINTIKELIKSKCIN